MLPGLQPGERVLKVGYGTYAETGHRATLRNQRGYDWFHHNGACAGHDLPSTR